MSQNQSAHQLCKIIIFASVHCIGFFKAFIEQMAGHFSLNVIILKKTKSKVNILVLYLQNIFHGSMSLDQLYLARPLPSLSDHRSPVKGLYLCGSGCHPGLLLMLNPQLNIEFQMWLLVVFNVV